MCGLYLIVIQICLYLYIPNTGCHIRIRNKCECNPVLILNRRQIEFHATKEVVCFTLNNNNNNTVLLKQKKRPVMDITGSFFLVLVRKRNPLYPIRANSFVSIIMYLTCTIIVLLKKINGMAYIFTLLNV
jgi:hypothetical protein